MKRIVSSAAALALSLAVGTLPTGVLAQGGISGMFARPGQKTSKPAPVRTAQAIRPTQAMSGHVMPGQAMPGADGNYEELPSPAHSAGGAPVQHFHGEGSYYPGEGYVDDSYGGYGYGGSNMGPGCSGCDDCYGCEDCCDTDYGYQSTSWWNCLGYGDLCCPSNGGSSWYFVGDYLYVRANFSEATSYVTEDLSQTAVARDIYHDLNFQEESSYRFGGGWKLDGCDEEVRFLFTQMSSYANDVAPEEGQIPYPIITPDGGVTFIHAEVDTRAWDLEYAKTIGLGGNLGCADDCACGDACQCGDTCGPCCPAWDITWSGGIRFATADWRRGYDVVDDDVETSGLASTTMDFDGFGFRTGLEGRRYFGQKGWFSVFAKGDISLLLGDVNLVSRLVTDPDTIDEVTIIQSSSNRNIIPVTEIEAGLSAKLSRHSNFSAGYLFSAWHDLGFRDQFAGYTDPNISILETDYDDANILGFDGFFARLELSF